jgi:hypothetical protein
MAAGSQVAFDAWSRCQSKRTRGNWKVRVARYPIISRQLEVRWRDLLRSNWSRSLKAHPEQSPVLRCSGVVPCLFRRTPFAR